jgi:Dolichyl-phosphate-mannose-protein mannosyltransferase
MWPSARSCLLIFIVAFVLDMIVANSMSQTFDEGHHLEYGTRILLGQPDRAGPYMDIKTPVAALNALPRLIGARFDDSSPRIRKFFLSLTMARFPSVMAALGVILFVYLLAYELYGGEAALGASVLAALSPNLIAHGTLATSDGYFALGVLATLFFFRRYLLHPNWANAWISGLALAIAQIMKPLAAFLYPLAALFLLAAALRHRWMKIGGKHLAVYALAAAVSYVVVLNVAYLFDRTFAPLSSYSFETPLFRSLQQAWPNVPVLVPYPVLQGLDMARHNDAVGATYGNIYLLGNLRSNNDPSFHGFKSYYLVAWLIKEPIALQILFIWGLILACRRRTETGFLFSVGLLLTASGILVLALSLLSKAQIGIRHILPVLAIEVVIAGGVFSDWVTLSSRKKRVAVLLVAWLAVSTFSYYPHMIPYMNEWVMDRKLSYRLLADSNLDWGQNAGLVHRFLQNNPDVVLDPDNPVSGRILVSANRLIGIAPKEKGPLTWALQYRPVGHVGYAHLLFQIPPDAR